MPLAEVLGDTGQVGEDAPPADGDLVTGRLPEPPAGLAALLGQKATS